MSLTPCSISLPDNIQFIQRNPIESPLNEQEKEFIQLENQPKKKFSFKNKNKKQKRTFSKKRMSFVFLYFKI
jgi:hypothetical protein